MRYSIIIAIAFLFIPFTNINAQEYDEFYLKFEAEVMEGKDILIAWAMLDDNRITVDPFSTGQIMPIYDTKKKNKSELLGKVVPLSTGELEIQLENTAENRALLEYGMSFIKIEAKLDVELNKENIMYDIFRLGIGMTDIQGDHNFSDWILSDDTKMNDEAYILKKMDEESDFVAKAMREQMDAPDVKEGRFKNMDLFEAMEIADENDVKSFLKYVKSRPFKYQGTDWKFSEIFATWIAEAAPTTIDDLKELAISSWGKNASFFKYFEDVSPSITKEVLEDLRSRCGNAIDNDKLDFAYLLADNALLLAKHINDPLEIAWSEHKKAKVFSAFKSYEEARPFYEKAMAYFNQEKVKSGILVVGNDAADNYNKLGEKDNYKKAISLLETSINIAVDFGKEDKTLSPVTALMYRNMGKSYQGLKKYKKALEYYEIGLEYTVIFTPIALKRKATLELAMAETYELMGESSLADKYSNEAVATYLEYEAALAAIKKL